MYTISTTFSSSLYAEDADDLRQGIPAEPQPLPPCDGDEEDSFRRHASRERGRTADPRKEKEENAEAVERRVASRYQGGGSPIRQRGVVHVRRSAQASWPSPIPLHWTPKAKEEVNRLPHDIKNRILTKLEWFSIQENPLHFAKRLSGTDVGLLRFRIGDYRAICRVIEGRIRVLRVLSVQHRSEAYRGIL